MGPETTDNCRDEILRTGSSGEARLVGLFTRTVNGVLERMESVQCQAEDGAK